MTDVTGQDDGSAGFELPSELARASALDRHDRRRDWVARLPSIVPSLADRWGLTLGPPFQPGGQGSWTAPAVDAEGRDLVLKAGWTHDEGTHEAAALRLWDGRGAVRLHDDHVDGDTTALLLERARPGVELGRSLPEPDQDAVVAGLLREMWVPPPAGHPFRPLAEMCDLWADEAEETPPPISTPACSGRASSCSAACRATRGPTRTCSCSPTCTGATCCRRSGARGW